MKARSRENRAFLVTGGHDRSEGGKRVIAYAKNSIDVSPMPKAFNACS